MSIFFTIILVLLGGCYGRPKMQVNSSEVARAANLLPGRPAVIVFSALWCHPCREEIDSLNQASRDFAGLIQFRGFLVEGEEKGSLVQNSDLGQFKSFTGQETQYGLRMDPAWKVFDSLHAPQGHALPTMVTVNSSGAIEQVIQQSLDYETQLRPLLIALARGQNTTTANPTAPTVPTKPGEQQLTDSVANWSTRAEVSTNLDLIKNLNESWQAGLKKFSFTAGEMPFESGQITFVWDGANQNTPRSAAWYSDTPISICTLNLVLNADGTLQSMSGNCRQK